MNLNEYQEGAMSTALGAATGDDAINYNTLKLNGEAGEVAELVGKWMRGDFGSYPNWLPAANKLQIAKELGDVLWYLAVLAWKVGYRLEDVAEMNLEKLADRKARGVLQGSGSDR